MKRDCRLIATLPSLSNLKKVQEVFESDCVDEVRFNTGVHVPFAAEEALDILQRLSLKYDKKLWIDVKGRQLRISKWADPLYSCIELNHHVEVLYPAEVCFRNGDRVRIAHIKDGNKLFVEPLPKEALGAGQSVNIIGRDVEIDGYLTEKDKEYLTACAKLGMPWIMASFVEEFLDFMEILTLQPNAQIMAKIESLKGMELVTRHPSVLMEKFNIFSLMAARDDLYIQTGENCSMLKHLKAIVDVDSGAVCASRIFPSLERRQTPEFADYADLELMYSMGYRRFMLCDNICNYHFEKAIKAWKEFQHG
ncbi:MAG: hypothetical protein IJ215_00520 [Clostridia bacterium]|nr:hypothetical protein [Clostridia bacterium]